MKLRILRWKDGSELSGWAQCNHNCAYKRRAGGAESETREVRRFYSAGFEDGGWVHELRSVGSLYKLEKAKKQILPKTFRRNAVLSTP